MREVLQHDALVADLLDLLEAVDHLLDGPDRPELAVALEHLLGVPAEAQADAPCGLPYFTLVVADHARRHQRVAQRGRVAARALARLVELLLARTNFVRVGEEGVVLVRKPHCGLDGAGLRAPADEDGEVWTGEAGRVVERVVLSLEIHYVLAQEAMHDL